MKLFILIYRFFLSLRYKVTIKGSEILDPKQAKLFLPNHQAHVDPQIVFSHMYKHDKVSPVVAERFYNTPVLRSLFKFFKAVPVSELDRGSRDTNVLENIFKNVNIHLQSGRSAILYPAGQIQGQGYEKIFNKQAAYQIVQHLPENTQVIGVRINGLWGSMWSKAWTGKSPLFFKTLLRGVWFTIANLLFLTPKRNVTIEYVDITEEAQKEAQKDKREFNTFLEDFYNVNGEEPVTFIKHYWFAPKLNRYLPSKIDGSVIDVQGTSKGEIDIPQDVFEKVKRILSTVGEVPENTISLEKNLSLDLGVDSLGLVHIIVAIEKEFANMSTPEVTKIKTVSDLCQLALGQEVIEEELKDSTLTQHGIASGRTTIDTSKTIHNLILDVFKGNKKEPFAYDRIIGSTTRKDFLLKAMVVSKIIEKEIDGKYVAIMLPALQSTALLVAATYMAGKVPVMLNWTMGQKVLEECIQEIGITKILTAGSFFEKVEDQLSDATKKMCIFFENKVREMKTSTKISGLLKYIFKSKFNVKLEDEAVILFTSGSESKPKIVSLTHKNVVNDLAGVIDSLYIDKQQIFLGFLPPFHSFGFSVLTVFPLITGIKIAYTPNPTDSKEVLTVLKHTGADTLLATPTFLKLLFSASRNDDFKNVKMAVTGAESLHPKVLNEFYEKASDDAVILEGYGITECSPVLTISPREKQKEKSVGKFLCNITGVIVDLQTQEILPPNTEGMIMVKGPNVFNGYVNPAIESPFVTINNEQYYKTGDLGYIDEEGFVFITGRLKRFIKIGGEMISLPAIENTLLEKYGSPDELVLAVEGSDSGETPQIVLFGTQEIDIQEANAFLREKGFSSLVKLTGYKPVHEIPVLGTGKTDYKVLKAMVP